MNLPLETKVLIVGAGPTGMALAIALQQAGVEHVIIDRLEEGLNTSRAGVIHAHTLEMLEGLGVAPEMRRRGMRVSDFRIRDRDRVLFELDFGRLPSKDRYLLMLPQDETEKILSDQLSVLGGTIYRGVTATAVEQDAEWARATVTGSFGSAVIQARYVVGGDGMHSIVRAASGTGFAGGTYGDSFVLADVRMDWPLGNEVSMFFSPEGMVVIAPLPNGIFRVVATVDDAPEHPGIEDVQGLLKSRGPTAGGNVVRELLWSSRFRVHHRVAESYRKGRFLLMGDAAHVHSPAGGQGMNTGLVDAVVLGQLLVRVIRAGQPDSTLDVYEQMRRPAAIKVVATAGLLTRVATVRARTMRFVRNLLLSFLSMVPPARRGVLMNLSGLSRRAFATLPALRL